MTLTGRESFGTTLRWHTGDGLGIGEVAMPPGLRLAEHDHESAQLCFVLEGTYLEQWSSREVRLSPGSVIFRPASMPHRNDFPVEAEVLTLLVSFSAERFTALGDTRSSELRFELFDPLRAELERELRRNDPETGSALEALAVLLSIRLARLEGGAESPAPPAWVREALAFIGRSFSDRICLEDVALQVGVHRSTLSAGFRRWVKRSVGEEIRRQRLREAIRRLIETDEPIALIALEAGFCDQPHLSRSITAATGLTPMEIRRRAH